jgi:hypothetical protein
VREGHFDGKGSDPVSEARGLDGALGREGEGDDPCDHDVGAHGGDPAKDRVATHGHRLDRGRCGSRGGGARRHPEVRISHGAW